MSEELKASGSWSSWEKHVLAELERLNGNYEKANKHIMDIKVDMGQLQVKAGIWGAVGGGIPILILIVLKVLGY